MTLPSPPRPFTTATAVIALLLASGAVYERLGAASEARSAVRPGRVVDIGGVRLHARVTGSGGPAVVMEGGAFGSAAAWSWIQQDLKPLTTVVSYDRAGHGWSEPARGPRDGAAIADELHTLLDRLGVPAPYILVGHSLGGLYARAYQLRHPDRVAGLVLVDASHPRQDAAPGIGPQMATLDRLLGAAPTLARLGALRLVSPFASQAEGLPAADRASVLLHLSRPAELDAIRAELRAWNRTTAPLLAATRLGALPLRVVTAGRVTPTWLALQRDLATLSPEATHVTVDGATHTSLLTDPIHARRVSAVIGELVRDVRGRTSPAAP